MTDDPTAHPPRCPTCGNDGPIHGKTFCEVCGEFVDWGELAAAERAKRTPTPAPAPAGTGSGEDEERRRARELLVPLADDPSAVLPGQPEPARPEVTPVSAVDENGVVCWNCGVGNRPDRRFCRNCGADLRAARTPAASGRSSRPGLPAWFRRHRKALLIGLGVTAALAGLGVAGFFLFPELLTDDTTDVATAAVTATDSDPAHPPTSAFDGNQSTWWGTGSPTGSDHGGGADVLSATFAHPVDVSATRIVPADAPQNSPEHVDLTFTDTDGHNRTFAVTLDGRGPQRASTPVRNATKVTLRVDSAHVTGPQRQVAIAEVQVESEEAGGGSGDDRDRGDQNEHQDQSSNDQNRHDQNKDDQDKDDQNTTKENGDRDDHGHDQGTARSDQQKEPDHG